MSDAYVMGLDISTHMGVAEGAPDGVPSLYTVHFTDSDDDFAYDRAMGRALVWVGTRLADRSNPRPTAVVFEGSQTGGFTGHTNFNTTRMLLGLLGVMTGAFNAKGIPVAVPAVSTIRKTFIGHGRLDGATAKRHTIAMCRLLGWSPEDHNAADAGAAWFHFVSPHNTDLAIRHRLLLKDLPVVEKSGGQDRTKRRPFPPR